MENSPIFSQLQFSHMENEKDRVNNHFFFSVTKLDDFMILGNYLDSLSQFAHRSNIGNCSATHIPLAKVKVK